MSIKHQTVVAALASGMALAVTACGSDGSDGDPSSAAAAAGNGTDRAFASAMIPHHESAIEMAEIAQERAESRFVRQLADDIVGTQNAEIETLRTQDAELEQAGVEDGELDMGHGGMHGDDDPSMLREAEPFDAAFIEMMIPHHEGAIAMARIELEKGSDPELKALAEDIIEAQQREIDAMRDQLGEHGGPDAMDDAG